MTLYPAAGGKSCLLPAGLAARSTPSQENLCGCFT
jgi:hypothetical protein